MDGFRGTVIHFNLTGDTLPLENVELLSCGTPGEQAGGPALGGCRSDPGHAEALDSIFEGGGLMGAVLGLMLGGCLAWIFDTLSPFVR